MKILQDIFEEVPEIRQLSGTPLFQQPVLFSSRIALVIQPLDSVVHRQTVLYHIDKHINQCDFHDICIDIAYVPGVV
jgi:hypothetical protein